MKIKLSPVRMDKLLSASVDGDKIILNDVTLDFSQLQEGEELPSGAIESPWICGSVSRINGDIHLTLMLPHGPNAPHETRFPAAYNTPIDIGAGELPLPCYNAEVQHD